MRGISDPEIPHKDGVTADLAALRELANDDIAGVIVQYPNFFGRIEPLKEMEEIIHGVKSMFIVSSNPLALGATTSPGCTRFIR